jgi:hypothetical protein
MQPKNTWILECCILLINNNLISLLGVADKKFLQLVDLVDRTQDK